MRTQRDVVTFANVTKRFDRKDRATKQTHDFFACRDLSFVVRDGEVVSLVGETGSGKSTALALLLGLSAPTSGHVSVLGIDPCNSFRDLRGRLGIVFQDDRLMPWLTALSNVTFGLKVLRTPKHAAAATGREWLARVGLAGFEDAYPHELSGGMRQRVSIARTFAIEPEVLVADEAFSALDEVTASSIREDLLRLIDETRKTTVFVTHSVSEAVATANRVLVFRKPGHVAREFDIPAALAVDQVSDIEEKIRSTLRESHSGESEASDKMHTASADGRVAGPI